MYKCYAFLDEGLDEDGNSSPVAIEITNVVYDSNTNWVSCTSKNDFYQMGVKADKVIIVDEDYKFDDEVLVL